MLAAAAGGAGALVGFAVGVLWLVAPLPEGGLSGAAAGLAVTVATAAALDAVGVGPPSIGRQVPRTWARLLPLPVAAALYGARLGVGPLTVLNTWLWWAAAAVGAWAGPWWSTAAGAMFGLARVAVLMPVGAGVAAGPAARFTPGPIPRSTAGLAMAARMARVQRHEQVTRRVTAGATAACALVVAAALLLGGCTGDGGDQDSRAHGEGGRERSSSSSSAAGTQGATDAAVDRATDTVAALLPDEVGPGYERVPDDARTGLGALDLDAAADAEVDTSAERSVLATRRFRRGVARAWRSQHDASATFDEVYVAVYEFADSKGAVAYLGDGLVTLEGRAAARYPVDNLDGATGFSQAERHPGGALTTHGVVFVRGTHFFLVLTASPRPGSTPTEAAALARTLADRQAAAPQSAAPQAAAPQPAAGR